MACSMVFRCKYDGEVALFSLPTGSSYDGLCDVVRSKFTNLGHDAFEINYVLPGSDPCVLRNDNDTSFMYAFFLISGSEHIELIVNRTCYTPAESTIVIPDVDPVFNPFIDVDIVDNSQGKVFLCEAWKGLITHVNQRFPRGVIDFRNQLGKYCIAMGFEVDFKKNHKTHITAICSKSESESSEWLMHAVLRRSDGSFVIKKLVNEHICTGRLMGRKSKMTRSKVVASVIADKVESEPSLSVKDVVKSMKREYGITVSYWNAWNAKEMAWREVHGDDAKSYSDLVHYTEILQRTNPGTRCSLEVEPETYRFCRIFIALGTSVNGFMRCIPILFVDATFLKNKFKGTLMAATAINGEGGIYPLCYAVVDSENSQNWLWFMGKLSDILMPQCRVVTIVSDRHKGLCDAVHKTFPTWPHSYCLYHIKNNIRSRFSGSKNHGIREQLVDIFTKCAYACRVSSFNKHMHDLKEPGGGDIVDFLKDLPPKYWANVYFPGKRYGELCSNIAESFNSWVLVERTLPITQLIDGIRIKMMEIIGERQNKASQWHSVLCPKMEDILAFYDKNTVNWLVKQSNHSLFEVVGKGKYSVNMSDCTCSCERWRVLGFPCAHVFFVAKQMGWSIYDYVDPYFRADVFREIYSFPIFPVPSIDEETINGDGGVVARPSLTKKQPGRPRNAQFKSRGESSQGTMLCSRCGNMGRHNRRTCTAPI